MEENIRDLIGAFKEETVVDDPVLRPYFVVAYTDGTGYSVCKLRQNNRGSWTYDIVNYPSSFDYCLKTIARLKVHDATAVHTINGYIQSWENIQDNIIEQMKTKGLKLK